MESEDVFECQLKKQRVLIHDKENIDPHILSSPLEAKLNEISFSRSDFEDSYSEQRFKNLRKHAGDLFRNPKKNSVKRKVTSPKKKKQPYAAVRVSRSGMTMFEMMRATDSPDKVITFLQEHGCLATQKLCPDCNGEMSLVERGDKIQSKVFRCKKRHGSTRCQRTISVTSNSFFFNIHISLFTAVWLLWGFCEGMTNLWFVRHLGLSKSTVTDWLNFCREVCMVCIEGQSRMIGGFGKIVEIDESKFVKRKYHRGKAKKCKDWVLGGICRETGECFMRIVPNRSKETLQKYIRKYVKPGSVIITDCWAAYTDIKEMVDNDGNELEYDHYTVNHSSEYVDPVTGAHTNTIEGMWAHVKRSCPKLGLRSDFLDGYLCRFIWFKLTLALGKDPFFFLLECIRQQYTLPESRLKNIAHEFVTKDSAEELIDI